MTTTATTPELLRYLADSVPWLAHRKDEAEDAFDELHAITRMVERTIDTQDVGKYAGPCDVCGRDMYARPGKRVVQCTRCILDYDLEPRRDWLLKQAEDRLERAADVCRALVSGWGIDINRHRLKQWELAGRLVVKQRDAVGRPLYRVGDVVKVAKEMAARQQEKRRGA